MIKYFIDPLISTIFKLSFVGLCAAALLYFAPLGMENSSSSCEAFINLELTSYPPDGDAFTATLARKLGPPIVEEIVRRRYPNTPPFISCTSAYWKAVYDSAQGKQPDFLGQGSLEKLVSPQQ